MRPQTFRVFASFLVHDLIVVKHEGDIVCEGRMQAESPEWTPACSMCSITPLITTLFCESASASTSISTASDKYLSINTGINFNSIHHKLVITIYCLHCPAT
ncbi:hypothetical protein Peur_041698 [Populus x canadensis]